MHAAKGSLAFGVVMGDASRREAFKEICDLLTRGLGAVVYPQLARSYADLALAFTTGTVELAWTPPLVAAELVEQGGASVLVVSRRDHSAQYRAVIFARRDSGIRAAPDLRGKHIAWVDPASASGHVVPAAWLRSNGLAPEDLFARESFLGTHGAVARAVLDGRADAGATFALFGAGLRATVEAGWTELDPASAEEIQMVVNAGAVPADCICRSSKVDAALCARIEEVFLGLEGAALQLFRRALGADGYERCSDEHLRSLRRLQLEAKRAAGKVPSSARG